MLPSPHRSGLAGLSTFDPTLNPSLRAMLQARGRP
jgi:hypothetical protein